MADMTPAMPTDAPTPSGAMLVWVPTGPDDIGDVKATTPFFGMYRLYEQADGKWYAYLLGHAGSLLIAGGSNVGFRDEASARAACEADYERRWREAGLVSAGEVERLRGTLRRIANVGPHPAAALDFRCQSIALAALAPTQIAPTPAPSVATVSADAIRAGRLLAAVDRLGLRALVAGWNGEDRDAPYEPHPGRLRIKLATTAGAVYEIDAAAEAVRAALLPAQEEQR